MFKGKNKTDCLSPFDRSFALGDGLFETVKVANGNAVWLAEHLERLSSSAKFCGILCEFSAEEIFQKCSEHVIKENIQEGFLRITLSRGETVSGRFSEMPKTGTLVIAGKNVDPVIAPAKASFAQWRTNETDPSVYHKTTSRFSSVMAWRLAREKGMDELVFENTTGCATEGIISNIFWLKNGALFTPAEKCGVLCGVTRAKVLAAAKKLGIPANVGEFPAESLLDADGIFFTNSLWVIRICAELDGKPFVAHDKNIKRIQDALF